MLNKTDCEESYIEILKQDNSARPDYAYNERLEKIKMKEKITSLYESKLLSKLGIKYPTKYYWECSDFSHLIPHNIVRVLESGYPNNLYPFMIYYYSAFNLLQIKEILNDFIDTSNDHTINVLLSIADNLSL